MTDVPFHTVVYSLTDCLSSLQDKGTEELISVYLFRHISPSSCPRWYPSRTYAGLYVSPPDSFVFAYPWLPTTSNTPVIRQQGIEPCDKRNMPSLIEFVETEICRAICLTSFDNTNIQPFAVALCPLIGR